MNFESLLPLMAMKSGAEMNAMLKNVVLVDFVRKAVPATVKYITAVFEARQSKRKQVMPAGKRTCTDASILLHRKYDDTHVNSAFDALNWKLCQLDQTKSMNISSKGVYVIGNKEAIRIDDDVCARQVSVTFDDKQDVVDASIELSSCTLGLTELKTFIADLEVAYRVFRDNQLGSSVYYFDEIPIGVQLNRDGQPQYDMAPKHMTFKSTVMHTNKTLANMYGASMHVVRKRVNFFLTNKKWYADKGIPYTLGLLLHGEPGCGKSSCLKAISHDSKRHVFNIRLTSSTTVSQIHSLFFSDQVTVVNNGVSQTLCIPIHKRLIVIEDIDCLSDVVKDRRLKVEQSLNKEEITPVEDECSVPFSTVCEDDGQPEPFNGPMLMYEPVSAQKAAPKKNSVVTHAEKLTLSCLLNVLDGVLETPGRMIVMTSNHPEVLDRALVRPGRIDAKVLFDKASQLDIQEMIQKICDMHCDLGALANIPERHWTVAEVTSKIFEQISADASCQLQDVIQALTPTQ